MHLSCANGAAAVSLIRLRKMLPEEPEEEPGRVPTGRHGARRKEPGGRA